MDLSRLTMAPELLEQVNAIMQKKIDQPELYEAVVEKIEPELKKSKYLKALLAHKMSPEGCKVLLALPDPDWKEGMGKYEVTDSFIKNLGMDPDFVKTQMEDAHYSGDIMFNPKVGPFVTKGCGKWMDLQNGKRWYERNGKGYYKTIGLMHEDEIGPIMERNADARLKAGIGSMCRIVPKYDTVKDIPGLLPAENYMEMLKSRRIISQNECACRQRNPERPSNGTVCLAANNVAEMLIDKDIGKEISWEDAMEHLRKLGKKEPFYSIQKNGDSIEHLGDVFCNCAGASCSVISHVLVTGSRHKVWDYYAKSRFRAKIDLDKCIHCGLCTKKRCLFNAIRTKYYAEHGIEDLFVDEDQCMGCGCCVETCPTKALTMYIVDPPEALLGYAKDYDGNYKDPKAIAAQLSEEEKAKQQKNLQGGVFANINNVTE